MYNILTFEGQLVGVTPFDWVPLPGVSVTSIEGEIPNLNRVVWDIENQVLIEQETPKLTQLDFMSRFSTAERIAVQASSDPVLKDAMMLLQMAEFIDITDQRTMMAVGYMAMTGVISNQRVEEILQ